MATCVVTATSNADGTMTLTSSTAGLTVVVDKPTDESRGQWRRALADFIIGKLYP